MNSTRSSRHSFYSASMLLLLLLNLSAVLNFIFQAVMRRNLSVPDFTLMNVIFRYLALGALPFVIYSHSLTRRWAELQNADRMNEAQRLWMAFLVVLMSFNILLHLSAWPLSKIGCSLLGTHQPSVVYISILCLGWNIIFYAAQAYTTARQWFVLLAVGSFTGALIRLVVGWLGSQSEEALVMALVASSLSGLIVAGGAFIRTSWRNLKSLPYRDLAPSRKELVAPMLAAIALFLICDVDLLILKNFYGPHDVHMFTDVNVLARSMFFLIGPISYVILPKTATTLQKSDFFQEPPIIRKALFLGASMLILAAGIFHVFAPWAFIFLGVKSTPEALTYLRMATWAVVPLSLCQLTIPLLVAQRQERYLMEFTALSVLLPLLLILVRGSLAQVFLIEAVLGVLLLMFITWRLKIQVVK